MDDRQQLELQPTVPDNKATFTNNSAPTSVTISTDAAINTIQFNAAAPAYSFTIANAGTLAINSGIVNGSSFAPAFTLAPGGGALGFLNNSSAGNATIFNNRKGVVLFGNSSSAGNATIVNDGVPISDNNLGGTLFFIASSTAGSVTILNRNDGFTGFDDTATAGNATITNSNNGPVDLSDQLLSGGTYFLTASSAGSATIVHNSGGITSFRGTSTAANATIINNGGTTYFGGQSTGGQARLVANAGGTVDISGLTSGGMTAGSIEGGGFYRLGSKQLIVGGTNLSTVVSGVITDGGVAGGSGGSLVKVGSGTLVLSGANTYTGPTSVVGGTLAINGSLTSNVTVGSAGTLGGSGTITGNVINNGVLSPGNSIGTLSIAGTYTQSAVSSYQAEVNGTGQGDKAAITGAAVIQGGTVSVTAASGSYAPRTTYTILTATGGVSGAYSSVTSRSPFLLPSLSYDANDVYLTLRIGGFQQAAQTSTQTAVGAVLDAAAPTATGDFATVLGAMATLSTSQGLAALTSVSGQNYSGFSNSMVQGAQLFMNNFALQAGGGGSSKRVALAEACDVACDTTSPGLWGAWSGVLGGTGTVGANAGTGTGIVTYNVGGFAAGLDRKLAPNLLAGITLGYTTGTQWAGGFDGHGTSDTFQAGHYASFNQGPVYIDGIAGYAYSYNQMWRNITIPGLQPRTAQGQTGANQFFGQVETGYRFDLGGTAEAFVTPFARLQAYTGTQNAFSEFGLQSLNLNVAAQTTNSLRSVLGAQLGGAVDLGWREKLVAQFRLGWSHEYGDTARPVSATFAGAPTVPFTTFGVSPQRDGVVVGLSANTAIAEATSVYLRYEGNISGQDSSHALTAGVRMAW